MQEELKTVFSQSGLRLTKPRITIFNFLHGSDDPVSIVEIVKACPTVDKVSVYRTIGLFSELRVISTVLQGWKQLYELASPFKPHHHHLVCDQCGKLTEIHSQKVESLITDLAQKFSFTPSGHHFEITGLCRDCSK